MKKMNKKILLETVLFAGALTGLLLWFLYGYSRSSEEVMNVNTNDYTTMDGMKNAPDRSSAFTPLEKDEETTPAEVDDTTVVELDSYVLSVDATGSEDLSDLD